MLFVVVLALTHHLDRQDTIHLCVYIVKVAVYIAVYKYQGGVLLPDGRVVLVPAIAATIGLRTTWTDMIPYIVVYKLLRLIES